MLVVIIFSWVIRFQILSVCGQISEQMTGSRTPAQVELFLLNVFWSFSCLENTFNGERSVLNWTVINFSWVYFAPCFITNVQVFMFVSTSLYSRIIRFFKHCFLPITALSRQKQVSIYIYIYIYVCVCVYTYMYQILMLQNSIVILCPSCK
jgi:hypothetical protein